MVDRLAVGTHEFQLFEWNVRPLASFDDRIAEKRAEQEVHLADAGRMGRGVRDPENRLAKIIGVRNGVCRQGLDDLVEGFSADIDKRNVDAIG